MTELVSLLAAEAAAPVADVVTDFAAAIAASYPPGAARAVIFYGSCLREQAFEGMMLDFYLIVANYDAAYGKRWLARANRLLPPNVFPARHSGQTGDLIAKVAVLSEADLALLCSPMAGDVSVWARFAQPVRLVWAADGEARRSVSLGLAGAVRTLFHLARPMLPPDEPWEALAIWRQGFALTYGAELRAERKGRSDSVVDADPARYQAVGDAVIAEGIALLPPKAAAQRWASFRRRGKLLTLARLAKASATYAGGIDYLAWKINRHAGTRIELRDWQRRWPILGALTLLPRLLRQGAVK